MRKIFYLFFVTTLLLSCKKETKINYVLLSGSIENSKAQELNISGRDFKKDISISEDGSFTDTLYLEKDGYYNVRAGRSYTNLFLENGYNLTIAINPENKERAFTYTGSGQEINTYLADKQSLQRTLMNDHKALYSLDENAYKSKQKAIKSSLDSLLAAAKLDSRFEKLENDNIFYAYGSGLLSYVPIHEYYTKKEEYQVSDGFYDDIKAINYDDEVTYIQIPAYRNLVLDKYGERYNQYYEEHHSASKAFLALTKDLSEGNVKGIIRDDIMNRYISFSLTTDENMELVYNTFMENVQNEEYKNQIIEKYQKIQNLVQGKPSPTFEYENHKGGKTTLADLRGKYVYIDVWATWCGPCKAEIPSLKKLEEDYHEKNIEFVSISIDSKEDYESWKKMVVDEELGGVQLIADNDWKSQFVTDYDIQGIPRFILIDPEGNIVNADAPRPSNEEIRTLLNTLKI